MGKYKRAQRWLGGSLIVMLVAGCGLMPGADKDSAEAKEDSSMSAKLKRAALAKLCEQGVACEAEQVDQALKALGAVLEDLPTQDQLKQMASHDGDDGDAQSRAPAADMAALMEMVNAMAGNEAFGGDDGAAGIMAAVGGMQPSVDAADPVPEATGSASEAEMMVALGGIPVQTGNLTVAELRDQLLTPSGEE